MTKEDYKAEHTLIHGCNFYLMKRIDSNTQCLSLAKIKAYLGNEVSEQEKIVFTSHFSSCELCSEVKDSFSTVNELGVEEDIEDLRDELFETVNQRRNTTRRLFISRIAAGILLPITGAAAFFYWKDTTDERLYKENFQAYDIPDMTMRGGGTEEYDNISLPKALKAAIDNYSIGNYKESIPYFKTYHKTQPENNYANFLHGIAQLEEHNLDTAIYFLERVRMNDTNLYEDATWYLALAHLKNKDKDAAKQILSELIGNSQFYGEKAKVLKNKL